MSVGTRGALVAIQRVLVTIGRGRRLRSLGEGGRSGSRFAFEKRAEELGDVVRLGELDALLEWNPSALVSTVATLNLLVNAQRYILFEDLGSLPFINCIRVISVSSPEHSA